MTSAAGVTYTGACPERSRGNGDGKRVSKSNGKLYWYGMGSSALDESDASGNITNEYVFFRGKRIARRDSSNNVSYYFADHLGTARVVTNASGTILGDSDFYPFGGERPIVSSSGNTYKFTGKERDSESGLDDFGARYYSSALGRFVSSDWSAIPVAVPYAELTNPQTLNLYTYVKNNPLHFTDPTGHGYAMFDTRNSSGGGDLPMADSEGEELTTEAQDEERLTVEVVTVTIGGPAAQQQEAQQPQQPQNQMTTSSAGVDFIKGWEGWNGTYDKKTGKWLPKDDGFGNGTIGWGHNCGKCTDFKDRITKEQGDALLTKDLGRFEKAVNDLGANLSQQQFDALVGFAFNVRNFGSSTLFSNVASGAAVTKGNFTAYGHARVNGKLVEVPSLVRRRESEYNLYANGVYDSSH